MGDAVEAAIEKRCLKFVMPGLGHPRLSCSKEGVDGRDKPGHDEFAYSSPAPLAHLYFAPSTATGISVEYA